MSVSHLWLQLALPHRDAVPTHLCQLPLLFLIPFFVALDFLLPKISIRLWHLKVFAAFVSMPETSVDKHARAVFPQHQVGVPGETRGVETVAEAMFPKIVTDDYLRVCTLGPNRGHITMYLLGGLPHSYLKRT